MPSSSTSAAVSSATVSGEVAVERMYRCQGAGGQCSERGTQRRVPVSSMVLSSSPPPPPPPRLTSGGCHTVMFLMKNRSLGGLHPSLYRAMPAMMQHTSMAASGLLIRRDCTWTTLTVPPGEPCKQAQARHRRVRLTWRVNSITRCRDGTYPASGSCRRRTC